MTDEERAEEERMLRRDAGDGKDEEEGGPQKRKFMQKYYHKGAFYMDSSSVKDSTDVRSKDYASQPTLEDHVDKSSLPSVLQVKNFGKRGRTKYTHLLDQDTTFSMKDQKRTDMRADDRVLQSYLDKRSGVGKL